MPDPFRPEPFSVIRTDHHGGVRLALHGELDLAGVDRVRGAAKEIPSGAQVVVDLRDLAFMDSSGLRTLMNLDVRSRTEGWSLEFTRPQPAVLRILRLCGFEDRVPFTHG